jgi:hypothetical protein
VKYPSQQEIDRITSIVLDSGAQSVGISLCNSYLSSVNESNLRDHLIKSGISNV